MEKRYFELTGPMPIRSQVEQSCPPSMEWALLAAGNVNGERAQSLLAHVAECESCGLTLRLAAEALAEDEFAAVEPPPTGWAARLAGAISEEKPKVVAMKPRQSWWKFAAAAAALLVLIAGWQWRERTAEPDAATLLAQAYSERRPFDFRFAGAAHAPVRVERSTMLSRPRPLLQAELQIKEALAERPSDAAVLQLQARAEMLEFEPALAVNTLQKALRLRPQDASLLADLGAAHAQLGNWPQAHQALTAALALDPQHQVALFNRALVNERRNEKAEALADWDRLLALDNDSGWAKEARDHRATLN
jgi:tetratricopeptide (TPR) repeat protein